jgi:HD-GYP domain-containing protein (c-di-GMP phosphodiesterase class II)
MTSDRPYRKGLPAVAAFVEIEKMAGTQFDPAFAAGFLEIKESILEEMQNQSQLQSTNRKTRPVSVG